MRILEVINSHSSLFEASDTPNSQGKIIHGQYARSGKDLIRDGNDFYVWLYDLKDMLGPTTDYTPGYWWNPDITPKDEDPNVEVDPESEEYKKALAFAKTNNPRGTPDLKKIRTQLQKTNKKDFDIQDDAEIIIEYIPNNATSGAWHRIGTESEPFNLGRSKNFQHREKVAELMFTMLGDRRFTPIYNPKDDSYDYSESVIQVKGNIESDGKIDQKVMKNFYGDEESNSKGLKRQNTELYNKRQQEKQGVLLKHDRVYTLEPSGVKYKYQSELQQQNRKPDGTTETVTIQMDPLKYPDDPNHQPYFVRQADNKKVDPFSYEHAMLCASLGYEADTVTRLDDTVGKKIKDWFFDQFELYGDNMDPKAPLFTKIIQRGVYNPISKFVFNQVRKSVDTYYGTLKTAYGWQKEQGKINETDQAKRNIVYWEQKLALLLTDVKTGRVDQTKAELLDLVQVHLDEYKKAVANELKGKDGKVLKFDKAFKQTAEQNIKKYEDILKKYYGGRFRKGQLVVITPDAKGQGASGNFQFDTINFKCSGKVMGAGIDNENSLIPFLNTDSKGNILEPSPEDKKLINLGKLGVKRNPDNDNQLMTRPMKIINSVKVMLHYPELGLTINQPQGPDGDGYYFYTGEVFPLKGNNTLTMSKDQHEILEKLRKEVQQEKEQEMPNFDTNEEEQQGIKQEGINIIGGDPKILSQKPEKPQAVINYKDVKQGTKITWTGIEGSLTGKPVNGVVQSNPIVDEFKTPLSFDVAVEGAEEYRFSLHPERVVSIR